MNANSRRKNPFRVPLEGYLLFLALLQVLVVGASLLKVRIGPEVALGFLGGALLAGGGYVALKVRGERKRQARRRKGWLEWLMIGLAVGMGGVYLLLWFLAVVSPDLSWDGNAYHIPPISMWAAKGYVHWIESPYLEEIINGYPKGAEVVALVLAMGLGNATLNSVNLVFLPLGVLGIASMAYGLGARGSVALVGGMLFVLVPVNVNQALTTYVDAAFGACVVALAAVVMETIQSPPAKKAGWGMALGAAAGLAMSIKSTGMVLTGLAVVLVAALAGWRLVTDKITIQRERSRRWRWLAVGVILTGVTAAAVVGFWPIRNLARTGSPLYPVGVSAFGRTIFPGVRVSEAIHEDDNTPYRIAGYPGAVRFLYTWLQDPENWPASIKGYDTRLGGLGYAWLVGCLPAMGLYFLTAMRKGSPGASGFAAAVVLLAGGFALTPMNWWARYTVWIHGAGLAALAWALETWLVRRPEKAVARILGRAWLTACLGVAILEGMISSVHALALATPGELGSSPLAFVQRETWEWPASYLFPEMEGTAVEELLVNGKRVGIGPHGESDFTQYTGLVGQLCQPVGKRQVVFLREEVEAGEVERLGIDHVLWDASVALPAGLEGLPSEAVGEFVVVEVR